VRLVFDATVLGPRPKGAGRVIANLISAIPQVRTDWAFAALVFEDGAEHLPDDGVVERIVLPRVSGTRWDLRGLSEAARDVGADVVFTHREVVSRNAPPTLMHVAEPPHYRLQGPRQTRPAKHMARDAILAGTFRASLRRARWATAASHATASWVRDRYGVDLPVIPPGIDPVFLSEAGPSPHGGTPYFLHPATGDQRDNTVLVLHAFARAGLSERGVKLVLIGTPARVRPRISELARALGLQGALLLGGWVSDERLRDLYHGAVALLHPTAYEGFVGLQVMEAMAQGTPAIVLDAPGVREGLEGSAVVIERPDAGELAHAMRGLMGDRDAARRMGERARLSVADFTWTAAAGRFVQVLTSDPRPV
jgi:glycosyltransferase involved in cell wall biosynthesis